jgi:hypothetical protein
LPYILDPNFEKYLPIIPSEVGDLRDLKQWNILENVN